MDGREPGLEVSRRGAPGTGTGADPPPPTKPPTAMQVVDDWLEAPPARPPGLRAAFDRLLLGPRSAWIVWTFGIAAPPLLLWAERPLLFRVVGFEALPLRPFTSTLGFAGVATLLLWRLRRSRAGGLTSAFLAGALGAAACGAAGIGALLLPKALGGLPREVFIVGCEPAEVDALTTELTPRVRAAVDTALDHVRRLLGRASPPDAVDALRQRDEILQIMFWLHGEGLGPDVAVPDILRFIDDERAVQRAVGHLVEDGYLEAVSGEAASLRYRLTPTGLHEGRRRFLDEFEPYLARSAHGGECGTADCDCHRGGECRSLA